MRMRDEEKIMSTYAVIETGNKQYWVEPKSVIDVELLDLGESAW